MFSIDRSVAENATMLAAKKTNSIDGVAADGASFFHLFSHLVYPGQPLF